MSRLVDFHCHLDLYPDFPSAIEMCEAAGIYTLTVTTTPKTWPHNLALTSKTKHVRAALGLHPQLVAERAGEIDLWESYLPQTRYVGEVGLDAGSKYYGSFDLQKQVFTRVLKACSSAGGKILTVHSSRAVKAVLDLIEQHLPSGQGKVVLHWFAGTKSEAIRAIDLGCYFSINAAMLENRSHQEVIAVLPRRRILTETDGPFIRTGVRPSQPTDIYSTIESFARLQGEEPSAVAAQIHDNLKVLLAS